MSTTTITTTNTTQTDRLKLPRDHGEFIEYFELSEQGGTLRPSTTRERRLSTNTQTSHHRNGTLTGTPSPTPFLPPRPTALQVLPKLLSCFLCVFVAGLNDGSLGALIPYILTHYRITSTMVGLLYGTSFLGWALGALLMPLTMRSLGGLRGTLLLGALCQVAAYLLRFWAPPYALFAATFLLASLGQSFQDAQANTFVAGIEGSHLWLGALHACWSAGTLVAPLMATAVASSAGVGGEQLGGWVGRRWALYYVVPLGVGVVNVGLVLVAFFRGPDVDTSHAHSEEPTAAGQSQGNPAAGREGQAPIAKNSIGSHMKAELWEAMRLKIFWLITTFFFFHLAAAMTIGGWIVVYLSEHRGMPLSRAGYVPTGYFAGLFLGRLILPHPTHTLLGGEHYMLLLYSFILLILQLISWFVPSAIATATVLSLMGFFFGPFFAAGVHVASEAFPRKVRTSALGLVFVGAQLGGSVFPAVTGAVVGRWGVGVLQPVVVGTIVAMGVGWWVIPKKRGVHPGGVGAERGGEGLGGEE